MDEMSENAKAVLHIICNNSPISKSDLGRRCTTQHGLMAMERHEIICDLIKRRYIKTKQPITVYLGRRPATRYIITTAGREARDEIIELQNSLGAC